MSKVSLFDGNDGMNLEVQLSLPWKPSSTVHYLLQTKWPLCSEAMSKPQSHIYLEGNYGSTQTQGDPT